LDCSWLTRGNLLLNEVYAGVGEYWLPEIRDTATIILIVSIRLLAIIKYVR
jgi:hypothetical protein